MMKFLLTVLFTILCITASSTSLASDLDHLKEMKSYLGSISFMADRGELSRIDATPVPELIQLTKRRYKLSIRQHAIQCLSLYRTEQSREALEKLLKSKRTPAPLFRILVPAYMEISGEKGVPTVARYIQHRNPKIRVLVVHSLGVFGGEAGVETIALHLGKERHLKVRKEMFRWTLVEKGFFKTLGP